MNQPASTACPIIRRSKSRQAVITRAVLAHLKKNTHPLEMQPRANTAQIAQALSLPRRAVDRALVSLGMRGVRVDVGGSDPAD